MRFFYPTKKEFHLEAKYKYKLVISNMKVKYKITLWHSNKKIKYESQIWTSFMTFFGSTKWTHQTLTEEQSHHDPLIFKLWQTWWFYNEKWIRIMLPVPEVLSRKIPMRSYYGFVIILLLNPSEMPDWHKSNWDSCWFNFATSADGEGVHVSLQTSS